MSDQFGPETNGREPVGRVNLRTPELPVASPSTGWNGRNVLIGVAALVIAIAGLVLILQGAFQLTPS